MLDFGVLVLKEDIQGARWELQLNILAQVMKKRFGIDGVFTLK
jgi:hypothetical protein